MRVRRWAGRSPCFPRRIARARVRPHGNTSNVFRAGPKPTWPGRWSSPLRRLPHEANLLAPDLGRPRPSRVLERRWNDDCGRERSGPERVNAVVGALRAEDKNVPVAQPRSAAPAVSTEREEPADWISLQPACASPA